MVWYVTEVIPSKVGALCVFLGQGAMTSSFSSVHNMQ